MIKNNSKANKLQIGTVQEIVTTQSQFVFERFGIMMNERRQDFDETNNYLLEINDNIKETRTSLFDILEITNQFIKTQ
jgi:hypothetical protein